MQPGWLRQGWVKWILSFSIKVWYAARLATSRLSEMDTFIFHQGMYTPLMTYSLSVTMFDTKTLNKIQCKAVQAILNKLGVSRSFPQWVAFGPKDMCGMVGHSVGHECRTRNSTNSILYQPSVLKRPSGELNANCNLVPTVGIRKWSTSAGESRGMGVLHNFMLVDFNSRISQSTHNQDHGCICQVRAAQLRAWPSYDGRGMQIGCLWELKES
jgi:hypothetical protein